MLTQEKSQLAMTDKVQEFLEKRTPVWLHPETVLLHIVSSAERNMTFQEIFMKLHIPWLFTTRGYIYDNYMMLYINDYEIPNINVSLLNYIFAYFPNIKWIGLGCNKGEEGDFWEPKLKVFRGNENTCTKTN